MEINKTPLKDAVILKYRILRDARGYFDVRYQKDKLFQLGLKTEFLQDNHSYSIPGVLRGLHYQLSPTQSKLVSVIRGKIFDYIIDLRTSSPSFGQGFGVELSESSETALFVPQGFAHGFCVLGTEPADVIYKVDAPYSPSGEKGLLFNDPDLDISWPVSSPILSEKDYKLSSWKDYLKSPDF